MVKQKTIDKYTKFIGKDFGCIHVDDIDLSNADKNRVYFFCTCKSCGRKFRLRSDNLESNSKHFGCSKCMGKWRKDHFKDLDSKKLPKDIRTKYSHFKNNAIVRGINFDLSEEEVLSLCSSKCFYCGKERCLGIDRIDNSKGYTIDNCVPCCGCCNKMKMDLHLDFFLQQIEKIYSNIKTIKSSSTIPKGSTSKAIVDGNGVHLKFERDGDIVKSAQ